MNQWMISIFSGAGVILLWELFLKPRVERRGIASALAAEVSRNAHYLHTQFECLESDQSSVPTGFRVSTTVFAVVAPQIGLLPPRVVADLVDLYYRFDELNRMVGAFRAIERRRSGDAEDRRRSIPPDIEELPRVFREYLRRTIPRAEDMVNMLGHCGAPGWTQRRWDRMTPRQREIAGGLTVDLDEHSPRDRAFR